MKNKIHFYFKSAALCGAALFFILNCRTLKNKQPANLKADLKGPRVWMTSGDESRKLVEQASLQFSTATNSYQNITVDPSKVYQTVDGFGYTLTGGSVEVINRLSKSKKTELLEELFSDSGIGISYLRLSIGASDLNSTVFSYNDLPKGETDLALSKFSLEKDKALIDLLKEILTLNPKIKIMATPWSPPVWMKNNDSSIGGSLKPKFYDVYARYFVKYIQAMKSEGISINAIMPQNEPLNPNNNPSLSMSWEEQNSFIKNYLGPIFKSSNIKTKIVIYDHNSDNIIYATKILSDKISNSYVDGTAFHLYAGQINTLGQLHNSFPKKNIYFTEQWTSSDGTFSEDFNWHMKNVIIGSMRNWSKTALEWNLANDISFDPHTLGGCTKCKGAVTIIDNSNYKKNVAFYIIAQISKFVPTGSKRISSSETENLTSAAFITPAKNKVIIVFNTATKTQNFNVKLDNKTVTTSLAKNTAGTYIFSQK